MQSIPATMIAMPRDKRRPAIRIARHLFLVGPGSLLSLGIAIQAARSTIRTYGDSDSAVYS